METRVILSFVLRFWMLIVRVPERVRPFYGVYLVVICLLTFNELRSTRHGSESQSHGDSQGCSLLDHFPVRERGQVAESPSVVLGGSSRSSKVGED